MRANDAEPALPDAPHYLKLARHAAGFQKELGVVHDADIALETARGACDFDEPTRATVIAALTVLRERLARRVVARLAGELGAIVLPEAT
jgi:hypothetical protein